MAVMKQISMILALICLVLFCVQLAIWTQFLSITVSINRPPPLSRESIVRSLQSYTASVLRDKSETESDGEQSQTLPLLDLSWPPSPSPSAGASVPAVQTPPPSLVLKKQSTKSDPVAKPERADFPSPTTATTTFAQKCRQSNAKFLSPPKSSSKGKKRPRIALTSFPRSGNSMTRLLIERGSGIWTGSIVYDERLRNTGYEGEGFNDDTVAVTKYHFWPQTVGGVEKNVDTKSIVIDTKRVMQYDKFIYVLRNPFDVFLSYISFVTTKEHNKTVNVAEEIFREATTLWVPRWKKHVQYFLQNLDSESRLSFPDGSRRPVMVIRYEDIVYPSNFTKCFEISWQGKIQQICTSLRYYELYRILKFLELPTSANTNLNPNYQNIMRHLLSLSDGGSDRGGWFDADSSQTQDSSHLPPYHGDGGYDPAEDEEQEDEEDPVFFPGFVPPQPVRVNSDIRRGSPPHQGPNNLGFQRPPQHRPLVHPAHAIQVPKSSVPRSSIVVQPQKSSQQSQQETQQSQQETPSKSGGRKRRKKNNNSVRPDTIRSQSDFVSVATPVTLEAIKCAFLQDNESGYKTRKKSYRHGYEAIPVDLRRWIMGEIKNELCFLGYYHYFGFFYEEMEIDCRGSQVSPHLTYSEFIPD